MADLIPTVHNCIDWENFDDGRDSTITVRTVLRNKHITGIKRLMKSAYKAGATHEIYVTWKQIREAYTDLYGIPPDPDELYKYFEYKKPKVVLLEHCYGVFRLNHALRHDSAIYVAFKYPYVNAMRVINRRETCFDIVQNF